FSLPDRAPEDIEDNREHLQVLRETTSGYSTCTTPPTTGKRTEAFSMYAQKTPGDP
ncbi:TPA: hypothetical protein IF077_004931, partial [Escherichia coli]|nr:hypothetical protein [Escherichia coli]